MTSRSSFFKEVLSELRRNLWAPMLSLIGFLFCVPLPCAVVIQRYYENLPMWKDVLENGWDPLADTAESIAWFLGGTNPFVALGMFIMATLCGVAFFRYLHDRRQVDLFHALPISRRHLFAVRYTAGIVGVLPIYLALTLITAAAVTAMGFGGALSAGLLARGFAVHIIFFLCLYAVAILCTVLTGNTVITVALGLVATFWVPASALMMNWLQEMFYDTYAGAGPVITRLIAYGSPLVSYFILTSSAGELVSVPTLDFFGNELPVSIGRFLLIFAVVAVVLTALCLLLFCIRRSERAGTAVAFAGAKLPIKVVVSLLVGAAGFLFFHYAFGSFWGWFGLVILTALAHGVCEIIYHFDFRKIAAHPLHLAALLVVGVAVLCGMQADITGYDRRLPALEEITGVQFHAGGEIGADVWGDDITDPDVIAMVYDIAVIGRDGQYTVDTWPDGESCVYFDVTFRLNNGWTFCREYHYIPSSTGVTDKIMEIMSTEAYIRASSRLQEIDAAEIRADQDSKLEIRTAAVIDGGAASAVILNPEKAAAVIEAMQAADFTHDSELRMRETPVLRLDLSYTGSDYGFSSYTYLPVYAADTEVLALIEEYTGVTPEPLTAEEVSSIEIYRDVYYYGEEGMYEPAATAALPEGTRTATVTDPETIAALLDGAITQGMINATDDLFTSHGAISGDGYNISYSLTANLSGTGEQLYYADGEWPFELLDRLVDEAADT